MGRARGRRASVLACLDKYQFAVLLSLFSLLGNCLMSNRNVILLAFSFMTIVLFGVKMKMQVLEDFPSLVLWTKEMVLTSGHKARTDLATSLVD